MQALNISLNEINQHMQKLQEIKAFLEGGAFTKRDNEEKRAPELQIVIHKYWE